MSSRSRLPNSILCAVLVLRVLRVSRRVWPASRPASLAVCMPSPLGTPDQPVVRAVPPAGGELTTVLPAGGELTTFICKEEVLN